MSKEISPVTLNKRVNPTQDIQPDRERLEIFEELLHAEDTVSQEHNLNRTIPHAYLDFLNTLEEKL